MGVGSIVGVSVSVSVFAKPIAGIDYSKVEVRLFLLAKVGSCNGDR